MRAPSIVVLFSSFRCNSRCVMCSSWRKQTQQEQLSVEQVKTLFSDSVLRSSVRVVNLTGGEPTLRDDLLEVVRALVETCSKLERIDIPTNGIDTVQVVDQFERILAYLLPLNVKLAATVSLDGVKDVHEQVRQVPGAFVRVDRTIDELKELMGLYPGLSVGLNATIGKLNYRDLDNLWRYGEDKQLGINFTLAAISEIGVESLPAEQHFQMDPSQRQVVGAFIKRLLDGGRIGPTYAAFLIEWLHNGRRKGNCSFLAGEAVLIEPSGDVFACGNFRDFFLGNALQSSFGRLLRRARGAMAKDYARRCPQCNSNCYIKG